MSLRDDAKRLRVRDEALADDSAPPPSPADPGPPCLVAQTIKVSTYPTAAKVYFACVPASVFGAETEGGAVSITPNSGTLYALNLGGTIPPVGTALVLSFVGNRWVFRYDA